MRDNTDQFYTNLPLNNMGLDDLLGKEEEFITVPSDWHVVITDIKNSTEAVLNGQHQTVNLIATGSIVIVLNIANKMNLDVPFFFGGDGATFMLPQSMIAPVMQALSSYKKSSLSNFNLEIRTGTVAVSKIYKDGYQLRISKHSRSSVFSIPVVLGYGLTYAEKLIKGSEYSSLEYSHPENEPDMSGMQCRWDRIAAPINQEEVVSLLVTVRAEAEQSSMLRKVIQKIDQIYGPPWQRQPISVAKLRLESTYSSLKTELLVKFGKLPVMESIQGLIGSVYSFFFLRTMKGKRYLEHLVEMSDTIVIDGRINTVISGTASQREKLLESLVKMETAQEIFYGLHISNASVMSCYVRNMEDGHIHFVDGSEGGYTEAAKILKRKLNPML